MEFALGKMAMEANTNLLKNKISEESISKIRKYFDVSSSYVLDKLLLIVFPFNYSNISFGESLYRPDLYIPMMSLITVILLKAFFLGLTNQFHPEKLGLLLSRFILAQIGLSCLYKTLMYFSDISLDFTDLFCFSGYKFSVIILIKLVRTIYFGQFFSLYFYFSYFFFFSRSLKVAFINVSSHNSRLYVLFTVVGIDLLAIFAII